MTQTAATVLAAVALAIAGCGDGTGPEATGKAKSTSAGGRAKTNWTSFGYDYCGEAIIADGGPPKRGFRMSR